MEPDHMQPRRSSGALGTAQSSIHPLIAVLELILGSLLVASGSLMHEAGIYLSFLQQNSIISGSRVTGNLIEVTGNLMHEATRGYQEAP